MRSDVLFVYVKYLFIVGDVHVFWVGDHLGSVVEHRQLELALFSTVVAVLNGAGESLEGKSVGVNSSVLVELGSLSPVVQSLVQSVNDLVVLLDSAIKELVKVLGFDNSIEESVHRLLSGVVVELSTLFLKFFSHGTGHEHSNSE